jgi:DNA-binding NarL/FixJ family response regulator
MSAPLTDEENRMHPSRPGTPTTPPSIGSGVRPCRVAPATRQPDWPLTTRETEVLAAMAAGKANAAIAETLFVSRKAVEKHINAIFSKLLLSGHDEQHPRVQAVLIYLAKVQTAAADSSPAWHRAPVHQVQRRRSGTSRHCRP